VKGYSIKVLDRHDDMYISIFIRHTTFLESGDFVAGYRVGHMDGIWAIVLRFSTSKPEFRLVYA
jgi:hypothetical protein